MTKEEMLDLFLEETGFPKDRVTDYGMLETIKSVNGDMLTLKRYGLVVNMYNTFIIFTSDKFDLIKKQFV